MLYRKNVGRAERWGRAVLGVAAAAGALAVVGFTPQGWLLAASGLGLGLTGLVGFCPGPALANLGRGSGEVALFVGAMLAGIALHRFLTRERSPSLPTREWGLRR